MTSHVMQLRCGDLHSSKKCGKKLGEIRLVDGGLELWRERVSDSYLEAALSAVVDYEMAVVERVRLGLLDVGALSEEPGIDSHARKAIREHLTLVAVSVEVNGGLLVRQCVAIGAERDDLVLGLTVDKARTEYNRRTKRLEISSADNRCAKILRSMAYLTLDADNSIS